MSHLSQKPRDWSSAGLSVQSHELLVCSSANPGVVHCLTVAQAGCVNRNTVVIVE